MEVEVCGHIGAQRYERAASRTTYRNCYLGVPAVGGGVGSPGLHGIFPNVAAAHRQSRNPNGTVLHHLTGYGRLARVRLPGRGLW